MNGALAAVLAYLLVQFAIGLWVSRRIHSESDYLIAGRQLGYRLATFSLFATWFGAETIVGSAGTTYTDGVSLASAEPFGYAACLVILGIVFAAPLWRRKLTTFADFFRQRYSVPVERVAAVIMIPSSVLWAAAQVRAFAHVLASTGAGIDTDAAVAAAAGFTLLYTVFGGLLTDAITDLIQGVLLVLGLVVLLVAVVIHLDGPAGMAAAIASGPGMRFVPAEGASTLALLEEWAIPIFGSVIAAETVSRVIATRSAVVAQRASLLAGGMYLAVGLIPVLIGLAGRQLVPGIADPEQLLPTTARSLLPTLLFALFAGGMISAILSTVDSTLLVASGLFSHNLVVPIARVTDERVKLRLARGGVLLFGGIAYVLARRATGVFELVEQASALGSAGVLVTVSFGLFTTLGGPRTALATLLTGAAVYVVGSYGGWTAPFLASLGASLVVYVVGAAGSFLNRSSRAEHARACSDRSGISPDPIASGRGPSPDCLSEPTDLAET